MPGVPLVVRESTNLGSGCGLSRTADQMCRHQSRASLSPEEALAAEESLSVYCKPVELYNILQRRAIQNPSFLQRCLLYKIEAKRKQRIQVTVSLSGNANAEVQMPKNMFPLSVILARPVADMAATEHSTVYRLCRACALNSFSESGMKDQMEANFIIPEMKRLPADAHISNLTIIFISSGESNGASGENYQTEVHEKLASFPSKLEGLCLWGKLPIGFLCSSLEKCVTLSLGHRIEMISTIDMHQSVLKPSLPDKDSCLSFGALNMDSLSSYKMKVSISAQEIGAREKSPYDSYSYNDVPTPLLPHIIRLRAGNVLFNYKYYNNTLQKTEVTEDFTCPFCLEQCASFKGLRYHLSSSHDLFNFEYWVTEEYQAVTVSVRTDIGRFEVMSDGVDPRLQTFSYRSKLRRHRRLKSSAQSVNHVHPHVLEVDSPEPAMESSHVGCLQDAGIGSSLGPMTYPMVVEHPNGLSDGNSYKGEERPLKALVRTARHRSESYGSENHHAAECTELLTSSPDIEICPAAQASTSNEFAQPLCGNNLAPTTMLQFAKTRKLSFERADPRNRALLQKRQFFHSHRAQPMALEQVFSDRDSEDEVDDDIADFEDRRMLDDFVDVTKDEKQIMHLWNSFVRKQRVLADGHIPWACEAFSRLHGQDLLQTPALVWCWRLFMVKLWNHSLLDARTMNNCNIIILENYQNETSDHKQS
ncbi:polycomb group protein EMBRYONIC FLOWER 2 isoform X7 [Iris pallida]|uniref:Polycomb group protein EMBRYONIC FLOWER 2 isoform X7 n=1 Tax=Iris pallida TaxID=29817 RepID=A0AAX6HKB2_IRIPA|nr:polycomb group protein EMBRYONIC FLOWER 2 isoform X7 [Iris pallida]